MGEMLPFQIARLDENFGQLWPDVKTTFKEVWDANFWLTTSGMLFTLPAMACLLRNTKIERNLYSVD